MPTSRRNLRRDRSPFRFVAAFAAAALVHAVLALLFGSLGWFDALWRPAPSSGLASVPSGSDEPRPVELRTDVQERDADRIVEALRQPVPVSPEQQKREEEKKREEEDKNAKGQVVDIERPAIEAHPDNAKYLAEYDARVARETRGAVGRDRAGARRAIEGGEQARLPSPAPAPAGSPTARPGLPGPRHRAATETPRGLNGEEGAVTEVGPDGTEARPGAPGLPGTAPRPGLGEGGTPGTPGVPRPDLHPTEEMLARAIAKGSGSPDWLPGVDDGESTALNAKKFRYASFFNRVKRDVAKEWNPSVVYVRHDPDGNIYGIKDRVTVVRVHLRPDGALANITLQQSSGVGFLDDEAMEAFRRAAPFVHPPPQLIEGDGLIHFNFGFIFELSGHTSTKVFRYE